MPESTEGRAAAAGLYPIRTVARRTGVNPVTLRAWERRHGLVRPKRTASGHRLYSDGDIERIRRIMEMLRAGVAIGQVAQALEKAPDEAVETASLDSAWVDYRQHMREAVRVFDSARLEHIYNEALAIYPVTLVTSRVIAPLLRELGEAWARGEASVAEEHFFSVFLRNKLGARFHHRVGQTSGARIVLACLPGEVHEIGLMLFALSALARNFRVVLLGANLPLDPLPETTRQCGAEAVVLAGGASTSWAEVEPDFQQLVRALDVPVAVGGGICEPHADAIRAAGGVVLGEDHDAALLALETLLRRPR